jgi:hypothetical protein
LADEHAIAAVRHCVSGYDRDDDPHDVQPDRPGEFDAEHAGEKQTFEHPQDRPRCRKRDREPQEHPDRCSGERLHRLLIGVAATEHKAQAGSADKLDDNQRDRPAGAGSLAAGASDTSQAQHAQSSPPGDVELLGAMLADLDTPIATQAIAAALAWTAERVRAAAAQLRHELQQLGQTITLSPGDQLSLAPYATCISDEQRAAVRHEALTIDDTTAEVLLTALRGRRGERSWNKLDDNQRDIAMQLVAAGAITEDNGRLAASEHLATTSSSAPACGAGRSIASTPTEACPDCCLRLRATRVSVTAEFCHSTTAALSIASS